VFQISQGFLIKTYQNVALLTADDIAADAQTQESANTRILLSVYLVEPRRASSAVLKFSGTLGMHNRADKRSATIMAFSHFVLENSACKYMFADIQGKSWYCYPCTH
jgi:Alpha-kinase family